MDKVMSTRMDEAVIQRIGMLAGITGKSKKAIIEEAVRLYAEKVESEQGLDVLTQTFGAWKRSEHVDETVRHVEDSMRRAQERYKR